MREVTLDVVQGVGDIFWIYQKMSPYFDVINFNILCINHSVVQHRAEGFIKLLPKVGVINYKIVKSKEYDLVAHSDHPIAPILEHPYIVRPYACNWPLERGIRLEAIDAGYKVEWDIKFGVSAKRVFEFPHNTVYISGSKNKITWTVEQWFRLLDRIYNNQNRTERLPLILLGALYDAKPLQQLARLLRRTKIEVIEAIDNNPADAIRILRDSELFIGYQSGLNIIADNYNTRQIMLYFPFLKPMLNTWCKPGHAENGLFNAFTFDQVPSDVAHQFSHRRNP